MSWRSVFSYDTYSKDSLEIWKNKLYEDSTRICTRITKEVHHIGLELCDAPIFDGIGPVDTFLVQMEEVVPKNQMIQAMDVVIKGTHVCWCVTHR
jgi:hypothetical protein